MLLSREVNPADYFRVALGASHGSIRDLGHSAHEEVEEIVIEEEERVIESSPQVWAGHILETCAG